ncbi:hypothetical protein ACLOJK_016724 [Asimina triloba]
MDGIPMEQVFQYFSPSLFGSSGFIRAQQRQVTARGENQALKTIYGYWIPNALETIYGYWIPNEEPRSGMPCASSYLDRQIPRPETQASISIEWRNTKSMQMGKLIVTGT